MDMENKNRKLLKLLGFLVSSLVIIAGFTGCTDDNQEDGNLYDSQKEAVYNCLKTEMAMDITEKDLDEAILTTFTSGEKECYVIRKFNEVDNKTMIATTVVGVVEKDGKYRCEKETQDVAVSSLDINDRSGEDGYSECMISMDNVYVHAGQIYDETVSAYFDNKKLELDENNMFVYVTEDEDVKTFFDKSAE